MEKYQWLRDNLFCLASLAEFKGQPEVRKELMKLYHELELGRGEFPASQAQRKFEMCVSSAHVIPVDVAE